MELATPSFEEHVKNLSGKKEKRNYYSEIEFIGTFPLPPTHTHFCCLLLWFHCFFLD